MYERTQHGMADSGVKRCLRTSDISYHLYQQSLVNSRSTYMHKTAGRNAMIDIGVMLIR